MNKHDEEIDKLIAKAKGNPLHTFSLLLESQRRLLEAEKIMVNLIGGDSDDLSGVVGYLMKYNVAKVKK